ncbi:flagellar hook-associated protein 1 FlgK [Selenomonas ruminantium]|uniref:Flagellar hook-associated protein 1 n=1 Tax=Selenomonas ruminantium TaxID=971 RepID=A0A1M6UMV6_SELRU|nr:flagellar hook-associated protein FlgK [Selenomonas ruminantium]SHK70501.1 flagellar hook-associated protein 1 FlgK [Selenomonas ruminantium]
MRSTFSGLNTMVRGVFANQLSLDTVGHNITNASTEGYSRQAVNQVAARALEVSTVNGVGLVGNGVEALNIQRARNIYADKQFWAETSTHEYYKNQQVNYDKLEVIFDDSDQTGIKDAMAAFYKSWDALSTQASVDSNRVTVIEKGNIFIDKVKTAASQLQEQITAQYDDMRIHINTINDINTRIVELNKNIMSAEATGSSANDLRDQRDLLVDDLSKYMNLNVYEDGKGMYTLVSNGITMVNGINKLTLEMSDPYTNLDYGVNDYSIMIKESGVEYVPLNGSLRAQMDTIAEDKSYIDTLADMAGFMLTTFNSMHQQGVGIDGTDGDIGSYSNANPYTGPSYGINFFGDDNTNYSWDAANHCVVASEMISSTIVRSLSYNVESSNTGDIYTPEVNISGQLKTKSELVGIRIINAMNVNERITAPGGTSLVAARTLSVEKAVDGNGAYIKDANGRDTYVVKANGSGDGTNAVNVKSLFNLAAGDISTSAIVKINGAVVDMDNRSIYDISLNAYYTSAMSHLGTDANSVDKKESAQDDLITQIVNWRSSTSGVDWNEELTNMIMFQKGYSACSRCLTTMDEMLDKLINSTGTVGR